MLEFARVPRSVWREIKLRFMMSLETAREGGFTQPFRLTFPDTGCTFMITPFHPDILATGPEGAEARTQRLGRKSRVEGKGASVRVQLGGWRNLKKKTTKTQRQKVEQQK